MFVHPSQGKILIDFQIYPLVSDLRRIEQLYASRHSRLRSFLPQNPRGSLNNWLGPWLIHNELRLTEETQAVLNENDNNASVTLSDDILSVVRAGCPAEIPDECQSTIHIQCLAIWIRTPLHGSRQQLGGY
jgi:hypothetical protein